MEGKQWSDKDKDRRVMTTWRCVGASGWLEVGMHSIWHTTQGAIHTLIKEVVQINDRWWQRGCVEVECPCNLNSCARDLYTYTMSKEVGYHASTARNLQWEMAKKLCWCGASGAVGLVNSIFTSANGTLGGLWETYNIADKRWQTKFCWSLSVRGVELVVRSILTHTN